MAPFWCFLAVAGLVIAIAVAWYWRDRALSAERRAEANRDSLGYWQERACEWQDEANKWRGFLEKLEAGPEDGEEEPLALEYRDGIPGPEPHNDAQLFNLANAAFFFGWLAWDPRHD